MEGQGGCVYLIALIFFQTGSACVAQSGLKLNEDDLEVQILQSWPPEC